MRLDDLAIEPLSYLLRHPAPPYLQNFYSLFSGSTPLIAGPLVGRVFVYEPLQPEVFELGREEHPSVRLEWGNGISNSLEEAKKSALLISELAGNYNVHGVHNRSLDPVGDVARCVCEWKGSISLVSHMICKRWIDYFENSPAENTIIQVCHSEGVLQVYGALLQLPSEYRCRIYVLAVAPPVFIPEELCGRITHLVSEKDYVPLLALKSASSAGELDTFRILKPHKHAKGWDHNFDSPTYRDALAEELSTFVGTVSKQS